jgi:NAD(P)H-dependent FMN reductase
MMEFMPDRTPHIVLVSALTYAQECLLTLNLSVDLLDLRDYPPLPYPQSKGIAELDELMRRFDAADGWVMAVPVYNWTMSAVLLNFLHYTLDGGQRRYRPFVLIAGAGGPRAHLSLDGLARTMIYEVSAVQVGPAILAAGGEANRDTAYLDPALQERISKAMTALGYFATASNALADSRP